MNAPINVETNRDGTVAKVEIPLAGNGIDDASTEALATLRDEVLPSTVGKVDGVEYAVTGTTAELAGLQQGAAELDAEGVRLRAPVRLRRSCSSRSARS